MPVQASNDATERTPLHSDHHSQVHNDAHSNHEPQTSNHSSDPSLDNDTLPPRQIFLILSGLYILAFLAALDSTLVATLATPISNAFFSLSLLNWLASSFFIANAVSQPLAGRLTDLYGRRAGSIVAATLFCVGNVLCAVAGSTPVVILGRVIAGLGGGAIGPIVTFCVGDLLPLRRRGLWIGSVNVGFGIGSSLGGPVGGIINDFIGWRWAFWVQVPITVVGVVLIYLFLHLPPSSPSNDPPSLSSPKSTLRLIDYLGALLLTTILTIFLLALSVGGRLTPWTSPLTILGLTLPIFLVPLFLWHESRHPYPIFPPRLLKNGTVITACLINLLITLSRFGLFFYGPVFFLAQGYTTTAAGLRLVPESVALAITSISAGYVMRRTGRYYGLNMVAAAVFLGALVTIVITFRTPAGPPLWVPFVVFFFVGVGYAAMLGTTFIAFSAAVPQDEQAVVTSANYIFRSVGSAASVTIASVVFQHLLTRSLQRNFGSDAYGREMSRRIRESVGEMRRLRGQERDTAVRSYLEGLSGVWATLLVFAALAFVTGLFMREHRLYTRMDRGDQEDRTEAAPGDEP